MRQKKQPKDEYYSLQPILALGAHYNMIFGERSNGKTYAALEYAIRLFATMGYQTAIIRRMNEDFISKRAASYFNPLVKNNAVRKYTDGEYTDMYYYAGRWYFARYEESAKGVTKRVINEKPFAYAFALSQMEHEKSNGYPDIKTIIFEEFISRMGYLPDEFVLFMNMISTIVRDRNDVKIFMLGNTVNRYCPYFEEMGLRHIREMNQGDIDVYAIKHASGETLKIAVEYCKSREKGKKSDFYFSFDNQKLEMITNGIWEIDIYPHCPIKFRPKDILFTYFIEFNRDLLQCEIVQVGDNLFTFIHRKTTELKDTDNDLIYSTKFDSRPNWRRNIKQPVLDIEKRILWFYKADKVFYQDNNVGEIVRNYLMWCSKQGG